MHNMQKFSLSYPYPRHEHQESGDCLFASFLILTSFKPETAQASWQSRLVAPQLMLLRFCIRIVV